MKLMKPGKLFIRESSLFHRRSFHVCLMLLVILAGWVIYYLGLFHAGFNLLEAKTVESQLKTSIYLLEQNKVDLKDKLAIVQRTKQVEAEAHQQVKTDLKRLQQEIIELREEVGFYRGIVAPREGFEGLRIDRFSIEKADNSELYHFTLVLTQVKNNQRFIRGVAKLAFEGTENGLPQTLNLRSVSVEKVKDLKFKFRYFQKIEGNIVLPKTFVPRQVLVELKPQKKKSILSQFDWSELESELEGKARSL